MTPFRNIFTKNMQDLIWLPWNSWTILYSKRFDCLHTQSIFLYKIFLQYSRYPSSQRKFASLRFSVLCIFFYEVFVDHASSYSIRSVFSRFTQFSRPMDISPWPLTHCTSLLYEINNIIYNVLHGAMTLCYRGYFEHVIQFFRLPIACLG